MTASRITIGTVDVTEHVAAMFDALVGSLDWGSGFLDVETIEGILIVAELAGFEVGKEVHVDLPDLPEYPVGPGPHLTPDPDDPRSVELRYAELRRAHVAACDERNRVVRERIEAWCEQVRARARAMAGGE